MSRSFKNTPGWYDRNPWSKKQANQKIRHCEDIPNGMAYKKFYESYDIHDWKCSIWTKMDLRYVDNTEGHFVPRGIPKKIRCLKELKETKEYRRARSK